MKGQAGNMVLMLVVVVLGIYLIVNYSMPTAAVFGGFCSLDPSHSHDNNFIYAVYPEYSIDGCTYYTTVPNHGSSDRDRSLATMKTLGWEYLSCINYQQYSETTHF
jgi:hypothetical protein